jgi:hypothetical protein
MTKRVLLGGLVLFLAAAMPAFAGNNGGGSIIVHTNDAYSYLSTTVCTTTLSLPADCASAITRTDKATAAVIWFLASFVPSSSPAVASVYFGIDYDDTNLDVTTKFAPCGPPGTVEAPDAGWPADKLTAGNSVGFGSAVAGNTLFAFYYFKVDESLGAAGPYICSGANPTGGFAAFYDDGFPPVQANTTRFGCVKWYDTGSNTCPITPPSGACCKADASCQIVFSVAECQGLSGVYQGDNTVCDRACSACCYWVSTTVRRCVVTTQDDCLNDATWDQIKVVIDTSTVGADWSGPGNQCTDDPLQAATLWYCQNPLDVNAIQPTSWGKLKALYR